MRKRKPYVVGISIGFDAGEGWGAPPPPPSAPCSAIRRLTTLNLTLTSIP